jgi:hypothetical protein
VLEGHQRVRKHKTLKNSLSQSDFVPASFQDDEMEVVEEEEEEKSKGVVESIVETDLTDQLKEYKAINSKVRQEIIKIRKEREEILKQPVEPFKKLWTLEEKTSQLQEDMAQYCDLDLKLFKFWKPDELTDEMIVMLQDDHTPYFLVGLNLAAHFLDETLSPMEN